ncbi:MAG: shikimate dehydrogenase [Clostridia bacterium]|nr:shikimate dehydrogenase [Clostridia bacterium]
MKYGVIGETLAHSFSKEIHALFFGYDYSLREVENEELEGFIKSRDFCGINVTMPYKTRVIPFLDEVSAEAKRIGAVNTIVNDNGVLKGFNTDFYGLKGLIERAGINVRGKKALVCGSGGTSNTAYEVLLSLGAKEIYRLSRRRKDGCITYEEAYRRHKDAEITVNATPCGMFPNAGDCPIDINAFSSLEGVVDVIYNPLRSQLVIEAEKRGIKAVGGLYMLVAQAAYAGELFTGEKVPFEKIESVYREIYRSKLNVVLTGMPSSGKTTVGRALAKTLGTEFYDTDEMIAEREKRPAAKIFAQEGEEYFRRVESGIIKELSVRNRCVIATGGGAVLDPSNVDALKGNGRIVFLDRPLEMLVPTDDRPLSSNRADIEKRYCERCGIYSSTCDVRVVNDKSVNDAVAEITEEL